MGWEAPGGSLMPINAGQMEFYNVNRGELSLAAIL